MAAHPILHMNGFSFTPEHTAGTGEYMVEVREINLHPVINLYNRALGINLRVMEVKNFNFQSHTITVHYLPARELSSGRVEARDIENVVSEKSLDKGFLDLIPYANNNRKIAFVFAGAALLSAAVGLGSLVRHVFFKKNPWLLVGSAALSVLAFIGARYYENRAKLAIFTFASRVVNIYNQISTFTGPIADLKVDHAHPEWNFKNYH